MINCVGSLANANGVATDPANSRQAANTTLVMRPPFLCQAQSLRSRASVQVVLDLEIGTRVPQRSAVFKFQMIRSLSQDDVATHETYACGGGLPGTARHAPGSMGQSGSAVSSERRRHQPQQHA